MSVALIALVAALVVSYLVPSSPALRSMRWFAAWSSWLAERLRADRDPLEPVSPAAGWLGLLALTAPPLLLLALLQGALEGGFVAALFSFLVLFYAWGPRDLDRDVSAAVAAPDTAGRRMALAALAPERAGAEVVGEQAVDLVFRAALVRWFGVLLWFLLLGPFGALGYRLIATAAEAVPRADLPPGVADAALVARRILDWPAAQLVTLTLALVADFDAVIGAWRDWHAGPVRLEPGFLYAAGRATVRVELSADGACEEGATLAPDAFEAACGRARLRDAMSLAWRVLLAWLAVLALLVIAGWVA
ncbi:hypothetical protein [Coralloluteibacterium thermophilus]|uniref:Uncharacterized protein n=1 Tax=Coralloluteibacterium thermophilum TaxID=2707049 RepID=A0ABV9NIE0_9GAMM